MNSTGTAIGKWIIVQGGERFFFLTARGASISFGGLGSATMPVAAVDGAAALIGAVKNIRF